MQMQIVFKLISREVPNLDLDDFCRFHVTTAPLVAAVANMLSDQMQNVLIDQC